MDKQLEQKVRDFYVQIVIPEQQQAALRYEAQIKQYFRQYYDRYSARAEPRTEPREKEKHRRHYR